MFEHLPGLNRKIAILGDRGVGKSSLTTRYMNNIFVESYDPTIETTYRKRINVRNIQINAEIVDTAGMDEYSRMSRNATVGVDGYILVYSITSEDSLKKVQFINTTLLHMLGDPPSVPRVLVGTMNDLDGKHRQVSYETGRVIAQELGVEFGGEISSKTGENVRYCFDELFSQILAEVDPEDIFVENDPNNQSHRSNTIDSNTDHINDEYDNDNNEQQSNDNCVIS